MKPVGEMTMGELAACVCSHLQRHGIEVVLSGGSCVNLYAEGAFVSYDLDFIETMAAGRRKLNRILGEIGFIPEGRYYRHAQTPFLLEFPSGPLAVGNEPPGEIRILHFETGSLKALSPTDCIKDRLAAFYHWHDRQCLEQALAVAAACGDTVAIEEIERWSRDEGEPGKFSEFRARLTTRN